MLETVKSIVNHFGIDALYDGNRLLGAFADLQPQKKIELKMLEILVKCNGHKALLDIRNHSSSDQVIAIKKLVFQLTSQHLISENSAISACRGFWLGIGGSDVVFTTSFSKNNSVTYEAPKHQPESVNQSLRSQNHVSIPIENSHQKSHRKRNLFIFLIIALSGFILLFILITNQQNNTDFEKILASETAEEIIEAYVYDFDKNGQEEAFITTQSDDPDYHNLWFVSTSGAISVAEIGHMPQILVTDDGYILVPWRAGYGATICFGVHHGQVKTLEIYSVNIFQDEDSKVIYSVSEIFTQTGEYHVNTVCTFDADSFELVLTDEFYESDADAAPYCRNRVPPTISEESEITEETTFSENDIEFLNSELYLNSVDSIPGTIFEWCYEDFDSDGKMEAFVGAGDEENYHGEHGIKSLWYLSDTGDTTCIINEKQYWYLNNTVFTFDNCKILLIDGRHGCYGIWGVKDNSPCEVSGVFYRWIYQIEETGVLYGADKNDPLHHILEFNYKEMSISDTGKTVLP